MDYKETAEQIRNGPADIPLVTKVLVELLEDLAPKDNSNTVDEYPAAAALADLTLTDTPTEKELTQPNASVVPTTVIG